MACMWLKMGGPGEWFFCLHIHFSDVVSGLSALMHGT